MFFFFACPFPPIHVRTSHHSHETAASSLPLPQLFAQALLLGLRHGRPFRLRQRRLGRRRRAGDGSRSSSSRPGHGGGGCTLHGPPALDDRAGRRDVDQADGNTAALATPAPPTPRRAPPGRGALVAATPAAGRGGSAVGISGRSEARGGVL